MKTSKTSIVRLASGLALLAASSAAMASVTNTPHNLSSDTANGGAIFAGTTEVCIFCHTPHGGDIRTAAPIWNRKVSDTNIYTRFGSMNRFSFDAKEAPIGSVSIACLSCHDGTQARDAVINGSGSGSDGNVGGVGVTASWMDGTNTTTGYLSSLQASDNGTIGDLIYLGTDLRNDHPISMQYGGGGISAGNTATTDPDFAQGGAGPGSFGSTAGNHAAASSTNFGVAGSATGVVVETMDPHGSTKFWYIDTGTGGYQATDFPLYTRTDAADTNAQPYVECATCHDPHSNQTTFLRLVGANESSQVCLTCHAK